MSDIVDAIENGFKELLKSKPYRSVTVKDICAKAHIGRNTFYLNFRDKRAIVAHLFRQDAVIPFRNMIEALSIETVHEASPTIFQSFYRGIYENGEYYIDLVSPMCGVDPTFELVVSRCIYKEFRELMAKRGFAGSETEADYIAYHYAAAQAIFLEKWITDHFALSVEEIARLYSSIVTDHWGKLFQTA